MTLTLNGFDYEIDYKFEDGYYWIDTLNGVPRKFFNMKLPEVNELFTKLEDKLQSEAAEAEASIQVDMVIDTAREDKI